MRILGRGKTALAIQEKYPKTLMFDDNHCENFDINSDEQTVISPGIPPHNHLVKNTKNQISDYDLFEDLMPYNIWISGTNGKTTTTQMLQHILEEKGSICGGNIGVPIALMDTKAKIWILETSSFTLHYTSKAKPNLYILLPISEDHISWHGSFKEYEKAKLKPLANLQANDIAIVPSKYKDYKTLGKIISYEDSSSLANYFDIKKEKVNFKEPFLLDAILALGTKKILFDTIDYDKINSFTQDAHKLEEFRDRQNRVWVDDSKATNVDATIQALKSYKDKKILLILGGDDKSANLTPLFEELIKYDIQIFSIGANAIRLKELATKYNLKCDNLETLKKAVEKIATIYKNQNYIALLSPSAASFDQFDSYKHRGYFFKECVQKL